MVSNDPHYDNFSSICTAAAVMFKDANLKLPGTRYDLKNWLLLGKEGKDVYDQLSAANPTNESAFYPKEGQFIFRKQEAGDQYKEIYFHFDAAPLGFLSIAAHGHADALSVVLHVDGFPVLVDTGTYTYHTEPEWRNYFVSTAAHNTICIDNQNQALKAGPTLWLKHYRCNVMEAVKERDTEWVIARHDGYEKIGCSHSRSVHFEKLKNKFLIVDKVDTDAATHNLFQPWHLHPLVQVTPLNTHQYQLKNKAGGRSVLLTLDKQFAVTNVSGQEKPPMGWFSPSFMQKQATTVLAGELTSRSKQELIIKTTIEII